MHRLKEIDVLKALGIILMIMGHIGFGEHFDQWIHAFHMPMFFIISGFLYKKKDMKQTLVSRFKGLLIPYLFFAVFHLVIMCFVDIRDGVELQSSVPGYLFALFFKNHEFVPICGAIWFLTALFALDVSYSFIDCLGNEYLKPVVVAVLTSFGFVLSACGIILPFSVNAALVGVGLYFIGNKLRTLYDNNKWQSSLWLGVAGVIVCIFTIFLNRSVNVRMSIYGNVILFYFNALLMTFSLFNIATRLVKRESLLIKELSFIGKNSIVYLGFNQLVLIFLKNIHFNDDFINIVYKFVALIVCLAILHIISFVLTKTRLKTLIGR